MLPAEQETVRSILSLACGMAVGWLLVVLAVIGLALKLNAEGE